MSTGVGVLGQLMQCVDGALSGVMSDRGVALIDRTCPSGSLGRGTFQPSCESVAALVLLLNIDLEFGLYEVPDALDKMAAALSPGLKLDGWEPELHVLDAECRGGLWAALRCSRRPPDAATSAGGTSPAAGAAVPVTRAQPTTDDEVTARQRTARSHDTVTLQLWLAENMARSVRGAGQAPAGSISSVTVSDSVWDGGQGLFDLAHVDESKALHQQQQVLAKLEQHMRRRVQHGQTAAPASDWASKLSCGVAEARLLFWSRQHKGALHGARLVHSVWRNAIDVEQASRAVHESGDIAGPGSSSRNEATASAPAGSALMPAFMDDAILHLLDILALYTYIHADEEADEPEQVVARRVFQLVSGGSGPGLSICLPGGILAVEAGAAGTSGHTLQDQAVNDDEGAGLVVLDSCYPFSDLHATACAAAAGGKGRSAGAQMLRALAGRALQSLV